QICNFVRNYLGAFATRTQNLTHRFGAVGFSGATSCAASCSRRCAWWRRSSATFARSSALSFKSAAAASSFFAASLSTLAIAWYLLETLVHQYDFQALEPLTRAGDRCEREDDYDPR